MVVCCIFYFETFETVISGFCPCTCLATENSIDCTVKIEFDISNQYNRMNTCIFHFAYIASKHTVPFSFQCEMDSHLPKLLLLALPVYLSVWSRFDVLAYSHMLQRNDWLLLSILWHRFRFGKKWSGQLCKVSGFTIVYFNQNFARFQLRYMIFKCS